MTFQPPAIRQDQSRKVLEEVTQQKKNLLKQGAGVALNPAPVSTAIPSTSDSLNPAIRHALTQAQTSSFGYFVAQDSSFGNFILPVIPRLEPSK